MDELSADYRFVQEQSFEGNGYGIAITGNASGILYNKRVWAEAGVTEVPTSHEEFNAALHAIADNTDAIPYYTNYADGWPMSQWESLHAFTGDPDADNVLARTDAPWAEGEEHYQIDSLLYDIVADGLSEPDPLTTNWEESKTLIGSGQVATMVLGSWAIVQMQQAAEDAGFSADDIGYMPFPSQVDGVSYSTIGGDYKQGTNVHSDNIPAARAWIEWFTNESGHAFDEGGVSPIVDCPEPTTLGDFEPLGVQYVELNPPPAGEETLLSDIRTTSEIDLGGNVYRQRLVDIARGAADGDMASYFEELNTRWADARAQVGCGGAPDGTGHLRHRHRFAPPGHRAHRGDPARPPGPAGPGERLAVHPVVVPAHPTGTAGDVHVRTRGQHVPELGDELGRARPGPGVRRARELRRDLHPAGAVPGVLREPRQRRHIGRADGPGAVLRHDPVLQHPVPERVQGHPLLPLPRQRRGHRFVFLYFFQPDGTLDTVLQAVGLGDLSRHWLGDPDMVNIALAGTSVWRFMGLNFVLFLGAIQSIPGELYEASGLDGANRWHQFRYIIAPGIKRIISLSFILAISGSLSVFEIPFIMTGGANGSTTFVIQTVEMAFTHRKVGLAPAMAVVLLLIVLIVTWIQRRLVPDDEVNLT